MVRWRRTWALWPHWLVASAVVVGYVLLRYAVLNVAVPWVTSDTGDYLQIANVPLWDKQFYMADRTWGYPLFIKALPGPVSPSRIQTIMMGQGLISIACWVMLAAAAALAVRNKWLRHATFVAILLMSLAMPIIQWDGVLLAECLGLALAALAIAAAFVFVRRPSKVSLALALLGFFGFGVMRDTNAYTAVLLAVFVGMFVARRGSRSYGVVLVATCLALFAAYFVVANRSHRWPAQYVLTFAVLPNADERNYFVSHGMPWSPYVQHRFATGAPTYSGDARLAPFRRWLDTRAEPTYLSFLATHPRHLFLDPLQDMHPYLAPNLTLYRQANVHNVLPRMLRWIVYPEGMLGTLVWLGVLGAVSVTLLGLGRARLEPAVFVPGAFIVALIPGPFLVWHGGPGRFYDIDRHAIVISVFIRVAVLMLALLGADAALEARRESRKGPRPDDSARVPASGT
jgi:hypothetical protein